MRPVVLGITFASCLMAAMALGYSFLHVDLLTWLVCAIPAVALETSNLHYLRTHALSTVGMIPVALFALITPCASCLCAGPLEPVRLLLFVTLALLVALLLLFLLWFARLRGAYRKQPDLSPTAALIVLGGAIRGKEPCRTLARRLDVALRYWQQSPTRMLVLSGGPTPDGTITEAEAMAHYLQRGGVDSASLILEKRARNTYENIANSSRLLSERGYTGQLCVVSSDYHLWRAQRDARRLGVSLTPIASPTPRASILQQWCREVLTILMGR